ncbi:unnamed protein product [Albugo candida]|uniref:SEC7 domain-containing protein n=1 Tax=Albugo candida TaxID=65357 RepID=A0A024G4A5_9STRA|nr:unnamed protein product [Albugo candida]|eukprot:CCI41144.1 unnamed protein product [Albugo candida]
MNCVKGEIHNVLSMMRVNARWASHDRFRQEIPASTQSPLMRAFKQLHFALQTVTELNDVDTVTYLLPFIMVIESDKTSGFITGAAISSLNKFLLYRLLTCESVRADVAINRIALCISRCRFEETYRVDDEEVLMKLLEMVEYCIRSDAAHLLSTENVWKMVHLCHNICYQPGSSLHLSRAAENTLGHVILTVFDRIGELSAAAEEITPNTTPKGSILNTNGQVPQKRSHKVYRPFGIDLLERILNFLAQLISPSTDVEGETCILGLRLINIVLETAGTALGDHLSLVSVLQGDLSKYLLQNSETDELRVLSLVLRVVFNLFNSIKNHLKIQLEVFFTSVHMRIIDSPSCSDEQKELALESLLEFCREPALMLDLYINYDCDVHCTNLFEVLCSSLARNCQVTRVNGRLNALTLLCLEGLLAVVESIARRCSVPSAPLHSGAKSSTQSAFEPTIPLSQTSKINVLELQGHELARFTARNPSSHDATSWDNTRSNNAIDFCDFGKKSFSDSYSPPTSQPSSQKDRSLDEVSPMSSANDLMRMVLSAASSDSESEGDDSEIKLRINDQLAWLHTARERTAEVLQQRKQTKKRYALAAEKFNNDPKHWIQYAQQIELLPEELTPESVASFLLHVPGLNKTKVGDYLGDGPDDKYPFNAAVREAYVSMIDFANTQTLDEALRMFLAKFRLPGEAQKIDRMMECFSTHFYKQCASIGPLLDADAAYVLAFSIIMLNTDLHNDQVAKKMSLDEFLRNNRGINAGEDLPVEYLTTLYERIRDNQIQMQHDVSDLMDSSAALSVVDRYSTSWDGVLKRSENVVGASFTSDASILHLQAGTYEKEMFHLIADKTIQSILLAFEKSCDLTNMERALEGLSNCAKIALYFGMSEVFNSIMSSLSTYFLRFAHGILNGEKVYIFPSKMYADEDVAGQKLANMAQWTGSFQSLSEEEDDGLQAEVPAAVATRRLSIEAQEHAQNNSKAVSEEIHPVEEKYESELMDPFDANFDRNGTGQNSTPMRQEDYLNNAKTRRALLSLKQLFRFVQNRHDYFAKAWSSVAECILMFNELDVVPTSLAEMDDFVDSRGVPLPPIQAGNAVGSPRNSTTVDHGKDDGSRINHGTATGVSGKVREQSRRVAERQAAIRSRVMSNSGTYSASIASSLVPGSNDEGSGSMPTSFWDSLSSYLFAESESTDDTFFMVNQMLRDTVAKLGDGILEKENWLRMLRKLHENSLLSLLEILLSSRDPFKYTVRSSHNSIDVMMQENAILALELSVDLILVNSHRLLSLNLWEPFHAYAKRILSTPLAELQMQLLVERVVVHILRVSIRLFHDGKLRPKLMETLRLLLIMDEEMYQALSDRLACGVNMLLKANLVYLSQDFHDWHVLLGILESLVQYPSGRMLCWDTLQLLSDGGYLHAENVTLWIAVCLRFVNQPTAHACDALRLLQSVVTEESAFKPDEKTWLDVMRVMLSYLHDDRPEVSKTAWDCLYCSLLLPSISISEDTWIRCFEEDLFPLDDQVAFGAWKHNTAEGNMYSVTLLSKTFLHHMDTLNKSPNFQILWLQIIARLANKIKESSSLSEDTPTLVYETAMQSICNLFTVMQAEDMLSQKFNSTESELKLKFNGGKLGNSTNETEIALEGSTLLQATYMVLDDITSDIREKLGMPLLSGSVNDEAAVICTESKTVDETCVVHVEEKEMPVGCIESAPGKEICEAKEDEGHKVNYVNVCELMHEEVSEAV